MILQLFLLLAAVLLSPSLALPTSTTVTQNPWQVYPLTALGPASTANSTNTTISFVFMDPNSNTSARCSSSFPATSPPSTYLPCSNNTFAWELASFKSVESFTLKLEKRYKDDSVGDEGDITFFGQTDVAKGANYTCSGNGSSAGEQCSVVSRTTPILVPLTSATAKRNV
ncbi:MAG: hypothetical protein M1819_005911 [Sarea resinae]|nr:MAG: hypothetical protein M1819_005911 [Sarea resinae]